MLLALTNFGLSYWFFLQLAVILTVCRGMVFLLKFLGQPPVMAEVIAGVLLGPSLLGLLSREAQAWLFPEQSIPPLYVIAQFALVLYMFLVGAELRLDLVKQKARGAAGVSIAGIVVPFALGMGLAWLLRDRTDLFTEETPDLTRYLFLGAAMSITAFPMLARIIEERGIKDTPLGAFVLAAGATDDAIAWCVLALLLASMTGEPSIAVTTIGGGVLYVAVVLLAIRPLFKGIARHAEKRGELAHAHLGGIVILLMLGAWFTDRIGLYAVFGAFVMGAALPRGILTRELAAKLTPISAGVLLPVFFACSGLNTRITLVNTWPLVLVALACLGVACLGKFVACAAAAKLSGESTRQSLAIGALMNARGLMELIILNIGLERGLITPTLFSIMVIMAVVTTWLATPGFEWALGRKSGSGTVGLRGAGPG